MLKVSIASKKEIAMLALVSKPNSQIVGITRFHAAGKPRNQCSEFAMVVWLNHNADDPRIAATANCPSKSCVTILNCHINAAGTTTQVT